MQSFERKVDLIALFGTYLNSESLASFATAIGAKEFYYRVNIRYYAPATDGFGEELEFSPEYDLLYESKVLIKYLRKKLKSHRDYLRKDTRLSKLKWQAFYLLGVALLKWVDENIEEGFIEHENEWLESAEAFDEARIAANAVRYSDF